MSSPVSGPTEGRTGKEDRELEWQLTAADLGAVRRWLLERSSVDGLLIEPKTTQQLQDTYFDTEDWRIYRAGFALRVREDGVTDEATLKSLRSAREDAADRRELNEKLPGSGGANTLSEATGPVGARIHAVIGGHPLRPLFEIRTTRQRFAVREEQNQGELGEIALDETVISRPQGEPQANLTRVEVEASSEHHAPLEKLVKTLRAQCALSPSSENKYALGLKSVGLVPSPPPRFTPSTVDSSMTAAEVALANLRRLLSDWFTAEPGARLGDDPEQLHELRVSARRMYATLSLFAAYLPRSLARSRTTLKGLLDTLGSARDLDVHLWLLRNSCLQMTEAERARAEPLLQHLEAERSRARSQMLRALDCASTRKWLEQLTEALAHPSSTSSNSAPVRAVAVAPQLIRTRFRKLRKAIRALKPDSSMAELHALRMRAKKLRYAIESVSVIYGKPADEMLRALRRLQDRLGVEQDAHVTRDRLIGLSTAPPDGFSSETVFLMGRLAERSTASAPGRKRIEKAWRKARGRRWKALRAKMQELQPEVEASGTSTDADQSATGDDSGTERHQWADEADNKIQRSRAERTARDDDNATETRNT